MFHDHAADVHPQCPAAARNTAASLDVALSPLHARRLPRRQGPSEPAMYMHAYMLCSAVFALMLMDTCVHTRPSSQLQVGQGNRKSECTSRLMSRCVCRLAVERSSMFCNVA